MDKIHGSACTCLDTCTNSCHGECGCYAMPSVAIRNLPKAVYPPWSEKLPELHIDRVAALMYVREYLQATSKWPYRIFVLSGNFQQARFWARDNECPNDVWIFIRDIQSLRNFRFYPGGQLVICGTAAERLDWKEVKSEIDYLIHVKMLEYFNSEKQEVVNGSITRRDQ